MTQREAEQRMYEVLIQKTEAERDKAVYEAEQARLALEYTRTIVAGQTKGTLSCN